MGINLMRNLTPNCFKRDEPEYVAGVGNFAAERAESALCGVKVVRVLHPSPASPQSNSDWGGKVTEQLIAHGVWEQNSATKSYSREHAVLNYCPLLFLTDGTREGSLRNLTPDRLKRDEREELFALCDECLRGVVGVLEPEYVVGIGNFAAERAACGQGAVSIMT